jgi:hypothetical protein
MAETEVSFHNVKSVEAIDVVSFDESDRVKKFWTRKIVVTDDDGQQLSIQLFANRASALQVSVKV